MTIEGIIRMAKEAGFADEEIDICQQIFIHFAMLVAEHEREACARVCDERAQKKDLSNHRRCDADLLANEIRARGQA